MRILAVALLGSVLLSAALSGANEKTIPLGEAAEHALAQSQVAAPGGSPFHLKAKIVDTTNPDSDYKAEIEEYWVSPEKWSRTIESPHFSQTIIVNGDKTSEKDTGDYYPFWLRDLLTAMLDPLPMLQTLEQSSAQIQKPNGSGTTTSCARFQSKVGIPPVQNSAFSVFCFEGSRGLLTSVVTPGYDAIFKDYKPFKDKLVARRIVIDPEPGTTIEESITELTELPNPDESLFAIQQATPEAERLKTVPISETALRDMAQNASEISWPAVRSGKTSGVLSIYVSVDRNGQVRETWPLNSDNAGLDDIVRAQVMKWRLKPAVVKGVPVQVESILTFAFNTKIENLLPLLSDGEARKLATHTVEPTIPQGVAQAGTTYAVRVSVGQDGTFQGVENFSQLPSALFLAAYQALKQWHFRPYVRDGKPEFFKADIIFHVP